MLPAYETNDQVCGFVSEGAQSRSQPNRFARSNSEVAENIE
jgi:hypothetical protein